MNIPIAINEIRPGEEFVMDDYTDYETLDWHSDTTKPTEAEVTEGWNMHLNKQYQRDRQPEYPSIPDQLDMLWHAIDLDTLDKTSDFYNNLKAIKDKYPKE
jgi:hypothetical protein